jgi:flagellar assembly protein FliH
MAAAAKYLFDVDFGPAPPKPAEPAEPDAPVVPPVPTIPLPEHEAALAAAVERGYRDGMNAAEAQARTEAERQLAAALERIAVGIDKLRDSVKRTEGKFEAEAVEVAFSVGRKLANELIAKEPFAEIAALADQCFREMIGAPHLVVRVNNELYSQAKLKLEEIARTRGFEGKLVVMAEGDIPPGDCGIEWAGGGLKRDRAATEAAIGEAVERYITARRGESEKS